MEKDNFKGGTTTFDEKINKWRNSDAVEYINEGGTTDVIKEGLYCNHDIKDGPNDNPEIDVGLDCN